MSKPAQGSAARATSAKGRGRPRGSARDARRGGLSLASLLGEVGEARFFDEFYEKQPLHVEGGGAQRYQDLLEVDDLDVLFSQIASRGEEDVLVVRDGQRLGPMPDDRSLCVPHLRASLASGYSIVLYHAGRFWPPIATLVRLLAERLECPVHSALFLTPSSARAFARHFDCAELLVLQLAGTKEWRVHAPELELPLPSQERAINDTSAVAPIRSVRLAAGDLLYLPRGFAHTAVAGTEASLHLSVYFEPYVWRDLLHDLVDEAALREVALRRSLPPGVCRPPQAPPLVDRVLEHLGAAALQRAYELRRERLVSRLAAIAPDSRAGANGASTLRACDQVERVMGQLASVRRDVSGLRLTFPGGALDLPKELEPAVRFMARAEGAFAVRALPGALSDRTKLKLVRRLVRAGFLRPAETAGSLPDAR